MINENAFLKDNFNGAFSFWLFGVLSLICMVVVVKFVPETKGVSLEKMEEVMAAKLGKKQPVHTAESNA